MLTAEQQQRIMATLLARKENSLCADCNGKSPCWASLDFGVFICMNCAGAHRALGQSVTRVKSTKLDTWSRDWLEKMKVGNTVLNEYWQKKLGNMSNAQKPNINTPLEEIIIFVHNKYVYNKFVDPKEPLDSFIKRAQLSSTTQPQQRSQSVIYTKATHKQTTNTQQRAKNKDECPFTSFDAIIQGKINQQKKNSGSNNLIQLDAQRPKVETQKHIQTAQSSIHKHNHSHFYSISVKDNKAAHTDKFINFDNLINQKISKVQKQANNSNTLANDNKPSHHSQPFHFAKTYCPPHNPSHAKTSTKSFQHFDQFLLNPQASIKTQSSQTKQLNRKSNITLEINGRKQQGGKLSWIDQWK